MFVIRRFNHINSFKILVIPPDYIIVQKTSDPTGSYLFFGDSEKTGLVCSDVLPE